MLTFLVLFAAFPHRLEYPAHVLAGFGVAAIATVAVRRLWCDHTSGSVVRSWEAAAVLGVVAVAGVVSDLTVTGPFDVLDVANTVMGGLLSMAVVAGAASDHADTPAWPLVVAGVVLVVVGFLVRYPAQDTMEHVWWFG